MKLSIGIACMGQLGDTMGVWGCLIANTTDKQNVELLVVDNGSTDDTTGWLNRFIFPHFPDYKLIQNPENIGVVKTLKQIHENTTGEVIAIPHNDVYIFERDWNKRVISEFEKDEKLGLAGFLGNTGIGDNGGRINTASNLLDAETHGRRIIESETCVGFDGLCLILRRKMLDETGGFDQEYMYHHFYDRDISMQSHHAGWKNKIIPVFSHHRSGITANRPEYQKWISKQMGVEEGKGDQVSYLASEKRFLTKWKGYLPAFPY